MIDYVRDNVSDNIRCRVFTLCKTASSQTLHWKRPLETPHRMAKTTVSVLHKVKTLQLTGTPHNVEEKTLMEIRGHSRELTFKKERTQIIGNYP